MWVSVNFNDNWSSAFQRPQLHAWQLWLFSDIFFFIFLPYRWLCYRMLEMWCLYVVKIRDYWIRCGNCAICQLVTISAGYVILYFWFQSVIIFVGYLLCELYETYVVVCWYLETSVWNSASFSNVRLQSAAVLFSERRRFEDKLKLVFRPQSNWFRCVMMCYFYYL